VTVITFVLLWTRWADTARLGLRPWGFGFPSWEHSPARGLSTLYAVAPDSLRKLPANGSFAGILQCILLGLVTFFVLQNPKAGRRSKPFFLAKRQRGKFCDRKTFLRRASPLPPLARQRGWPDRPREKSRESLDPVCEEYLLTQGITGIRKAKVPQLFLDQEPSHWPVTISTG